MINPKRSCAAIVLALGFIHPNIAPAGPGASAISHDFVSEFGVVTENEIGDSGEVRMVAVVSDFALMGQCLTGGEEVVDGAIHASGNVISFECQGTAVQVTAIPRSVYGDDYFPRSEVGQVTFESWAGNHKTTDMLESGDHDGDGISNLMEYALGLDPTRADGATATTTEVKVEGGEIFLTLTYSRDVAKDDVQIAVQRSTDLAEGGWTSEGVVDEQVSISGGIETRVARIPMTGGSQFLRLSVRRSANR